MRVLVSSASKHGATDEIGQRITTTLESAGLLVVRVPPEAVVSVDGYDAIILGSAIYAGRWLGSARELVDRLGPDLRTKRVWLFSSGPLGDPPKPVEEPVGLAALIGATGAIEHRTFAGRIERANLGFGEKLVMSVVRAPEGDFRPWSDIDAWAEKIARVLEPAMAPA